MIHYIIKGCIHMYAYTDESKLKKLVIENRIAFIALNAQTKDNDEYINSCLITLKSKGFDTCKLIQPKLFTNKSDGSKNVLFTVRQGVKENELNMHALETWAYAMGNIVTVQEYIKARLL